MPVHDWSRVDAGVFHHFHQRWILTISDTLNAGLLTDDYYALAEQVAEGPIPDVVTLERRELLIGPSPGSAFASDSNLAVAEHPPQVQHTHSAEAEAVYAMRATRVAVYHVSGDQIIGYIEVVSPGNKNSDSAISRFTKKLAEAIERGCHLMVIDVHRPTARDPRGLHARFWNEHFGSSNTAPGVSDEKPLGMSAYRSDTVPTAYFEPFGVGDRLIDMPCFLTPDHYVNVPLEATYQEAWNSVPKRWKTVIENG